MSPVAADPSLLASLGDELTRIGYADFCGTFSPLTPRLDQWIEHRDDAPPDLRGVVDLFLLGQATALDDLPSGVRDVAQALAAAGFLLPEDGATVRTPGLVLLPLLGYWLFFQRPTRDPKLYFGDDSVALALRLRPVPGGRTLDLCAGPGVQSLVASGIAASVTAVEINPVAAHLAVANVTMNRREDRIAVLTGDLYDAVADHPPFDHVVANPPLLPVPRELRYPFVGDGGPDGMGVTRRVLAGLPRYLAEGGAAQVIGTCLSDGLLPFVADEIAAWCRDACFDVRLTVAAHVPLRPGTAMFDGLAATAATRDAAATLATFLAAGQATHLATFCLRACHGRGTLAIQDMSREFNAGLWFV